MRHIQFKLNTENNSIVEVIELSNKGSKVIASFDTINNEGYVNMDTEAIERTTDIKYFERTVIDNADVIYALPVFVQAKENAMNEVLTVTEEEVSKTEVIINTDEELSLYDILNNAIATMPMDRMDKLTKVQLRNNHFTSSTVLENLTVAFTENGYYITLGGCRCSYKFYVTKGFKHTRKPRTEVITDTQRESVYFDGI